MSRIAGALNALRSRGRKALIPYVTAGDPYADATPDIMHGLVAGGADIIELGVPFSDPIADGPVIQRATERALANGIALSDVIAMVRAFRATDAQTPVVLMGYLNPIERFGFERFATAAAAAGADGLLLVDCPIARLFVHLDEVPAEARLHRLAGLAGLEGEGRLLELGDHAVLAEPADIAATLRGTQVLGVLTRERSEILALNPKSP